MSIVDLVKVRPSSPPPSTTGEGFQSGIPHMATHNASVASPQEGDYDEGLDLQSGTRFTYSSPTRAYQENVYQYSTQDPSRSYRLHHGSRSATQQDGYSGEYTQGRSRYSALPEETHLYGNHFETPSASPSTSSISTPGIDAIRTRSGLRINRPSQSLKPLPSAAPKQSKPPKPKRVRKVKSKSETRVAKLDKPLSELTKSWTHVPIVDIEAYVNRPAEERRQEVENGKIPGRVKRPMNSFMLYRKAYQNRTKNWCLQNNHQVVSQVCGDSWPLEPEEVRAKFNEWARIERMNHQNAHPGYKFSPSKPLIEKASKRKPSPESDTEESDMDDFDWEQGQTRKPKRVKSKLSSQNKPYQPTSSPYDFSREVSQEPSMNSYTRSSYQMSNPGRQPPRQYDQMNLDNGQYYQQTVYHNPLIPGVEDVIMRKAVVPGMHYGLVGGLEYDSMGQYPLPEQLGTSDLKIDPLLMSQHTSMYDDEAFANPHRIYTESGEFNNNQWQGPYGLGDLEERNLGLFGTSQNYDSLHLQDQPPQPLNGSQDGWQIETLDVGHEFDKWMDEA